MLNVLTPEAALDVVTNCFADLVFEAESVTLSGAVGRVLHLDIVSEQCVPDFNRSTVDGYAVIASDTFGSSEGIMAILSVCGEVLMGESDVGRISSGSCMVVSTGGALPEGADAVVMVEDTEFYGTGLVGISKPAAPGNNVIFRGDDVFSGDLVLRAGTVLAPHDIGILAALGFSDVSVRRRPVVGIISTGDELVGVFDVPLYGQVRDVNLPLLFATVSRFGGVAVDFGLFRDDEVLICNAVQSAVRSCDVVLISGGSSAGERDLTVGIISSLGEVLFHGIAMKPGKPTVFGLVEGKPVFGLPGHPVAAYLVAGLFVRPLVERFMGASVRRRFVRARISEAVSSNHGRAEYIAVRFGCDGAVHPVRGKSGLIASLAGVDGYFCVPRDCEGLKAETEVEVYEF
jgi:molybdopterin molybdotransferase